MDIEGDGDGDEPELPGFGSIPISDSLPVLIGLSLIYGVFLLNKRRLICNLK
jgi:hypothetical protein